MSDIAKKPEKLASAVYLITSFFNEQEPLKWKLRILASNFTSLGFVLEERFFDELEKVRIEIRSVVLEMRSLLSLARNVGLVSDANFDIIERELANYLESIGLPDGLKEKEGHIVLSQSFFGTGIPNSLSSGDLALKEEKDKIQISESKRHIIDKEKIQIPEKREMLPSIHNLSSGSKSLKEFGVVSVKKNSRQSIIINLLKRKKEIMIKDVSPLINGCSEKTIQRELLAMVHDGVLRKIGEKRWSRYSLA